MENNKPKFRLRLNLFDGIVLILALAVGAYLAWNALKPSPTAGETSAQRTVRYTLRLGPLREGVGQRVHSGDPLEDTVRNYSLGTVVSCETAPATQQLLDESQHRHVIATIPDYEDAYITAEALCTVSGESIVAGGGYVLQVGKTVYLRGAGYIGPAEIVSIEREGLE